MKGFQGVRDTAADIAARREAGGGEFRLWFKLPNSGDSAVVRFLEQGEDVHWALMHELPPKGNQRWGDNRPCKNTANDGTECELCNGGSPRKFQGYINLIWRDAPVFARDDKGAIRKGPDGRPVVAETKDQVAVWEQGIQVFEELDGKDATYGGLTSRDFRITRRGTGFDTRYIIEPAVPDGGPIAMSADDEELAKEKYDLALDVTPPDSYDSPTGQQEEEAQQDTVASTSPFLNRS